jgi:hypothetical protein
MLYHVRTGSRGDPVGKWSPSRRCSLAEPAPGRARAPVRSILDSRLRPVSGTREKPFLGHILLHGKSESVQLCLQLPEGDEKMKYG